MPGAGYSTGAGETRLMYEGTGGELFGKMFVGLLLTGLTLGIYMPWFICKMLEYFASKTVAQTPAGPMRFSFRGQGGALFGKAFVGMLLTMITFGIYAPWFVVNMLKWGYENSSAQSASGRTFQLQFTGQGGQLFVKYLINGLLTGITFYIYTPWAICDIRRYMTANTQIVENGQPIGTMSFEGQGGALFGKFLLGGFLTIITFFIYLFWFEVDLKKFYYENTRIQIGGRTYSVSFNGTGGENFGLQIVNMLLAQLTFGIYSFWGITNILKWECEKTVIRG